MKKILLIALLIPTIFCSMSDDTDFRVKHYRPGMNPNALEFRPRSAPPAAPLRKEFANAFSDLPKDAPYSPSLLGLKTGHTQYREHDGKLLPRPIPVRIRFSLSTCSWVLEQYPL